jgi:hypothetical protein
MRQKSGLEKPPAEDAIRDIRHATRRHFSAEEKIRVVLEGLHRRALPPRGHRLVDVLSLVEGVPGGRQEAACWRHARRATWSPLQAV